jgi:hypothetical protein
MTQLGEMDLNIVLVIQLSPFNTDGDNNPRYKIVWLCKLESTKAHLEKCFGCDTTSMSNDIEADPLLVKHIGILNKYRGYLIKMKWVLDSNMKIGN